MPKSEILITRYGEMIDMINCLAIYEHGAKPKQKKRLFSYDEAISLR